MLGFENLAVEEIGEDDGILLFRGARRQLALLAAESGSTLYSARKIEDLKGVYEQVIRDLGTIYSIGYNPGERRDGKQHKIAVKVDVDGDGQYDNKDYVVQSRLFYNAPKAEKPAS